MSSTGMVIPDISGVIFRLNWATECTQKSTDLTFTNPEPRGKERERGLILCVYSKAKDQAKEDTEDQEAIRKES